MKSRYSMPLMACCFVVTVSGCAPALFPIPDESEQIRDPAILVALIVDRQKLIRTVSTTGRISSRSPSGPLRGRITTLISSDRNVRFDAWTPTWDLVGSFIGDFETFVYFERGQKHCLFGNSNFKTINKVLPLGIGFEQYAFSLMGTPPFIEANDWTVEFDRRAGCWVITGTNVDKISQSIWVDPDGTVRRARWRVGGHVSLDVSFSDMRRIDLDEATIRFPTKISIRVPDRKSHADLRFKDIEINGPVELGDLDQICPEGLERFFIR